MAKEQYRFVMSQNPGRIIPKEGYILEFDSYQEALKYERDINSLLRTMGLNKTITLLDYPTEAERRLYNKAKEPSD